MRNKKLLEEVNTVLEDVSNALEVERSSFFLLDKETMVLESIVAQGVENIIFSVPVGNGIVGRAVQKEAGAIENDAQNSEFFDSSFDRQLGFTTTSIACVPVHNDSGTVIGALQCLNIKRDKFDTTHLKLLDGFAATVSLIVKNTSLYIASEQIKDNFYTLLDVFGAISSELDLDNLIQLIMEKGAEITRADRSTLFFMDHEKNELWTKYAKGLGNQVIRTKKGIVAEVAKNKQPYIVNDPYDHPHFDSAIDSKTKYRTESILSVPVFDSAHAILGVVQVINKREGEFTESDSSILQSFATQIRITIENARLFDQINGMKNYLSTLVENLDNGIVTMDKSSRIQTTNQTFYKIFDLDAAHILNNMLLSDLDPSITTLLKYGEQTVRTGKKHYEYDIEFKTGKSRKVIANLSILPMTDSSGDIIGSVNVFHDVTKEKRIRSNLSRYIPEHLVNEVINKDDLSILHSKTRRCSVLFSDIRNFTKLTEELGAVQIVELLNQYFDAMVTSVHNYNGILDKFIGDAVMAVFGLPYTNTKDPVNAVRCALNMFDLLDNLNRSEHMGANLNIGIGISTGNVISGNIGSLKRFEYTVIGDPVNLAARLESETKKSKAKILICENTFKEVASYFECQEVGVVPIKGKRRPVKIYTVIREI